MGGGVVGVLGGGLKKNCYAAAITAFHFLVSILILAIIMDQY